MLKDKIAVVTGGGQGIGRCISELLAKQGATAIICELNPDTAMETKEAIEKDGGKADVFQVDVRNSSSVNATINKIVDKHGRIDILINNAGVTKDGLLMRMKDEDWSLVIDINLTGTMNFTRATLRPMMKQRYGRIVSIASVIGLMGNAGQSNYAASKAGIIGFTKSVAKEAASRGITANAVAPGFIETAMTKKLAPETREKYVQNIPLRSYGLPEDVSNAVLFLCSDMSKYITGQVLTVDGGMVM